MNRYAILSPEKETLDRTIRETRILAWEAFLDWYWPGRGGKQSAYDAGYRAVRVNITVEDTK